MKQFLISSDIYSYNLPQIPSLTREEGMSRGVCPALMQWNVPLEQAEVPTHQDSHIMYTY